MSLDYWLFTSACTKTLLILASEKFSMCARSPVSSTFDGAVQPVFAVVAVCMCVYVRVYRQPCSAALPLSRID